MTCMQRGSGAPRGGGGWWGCLLRVSEEWALFQGQILHILTHAAADNDVSGMCATRPRVLPRDLGTNPTWVTLHLLMLSHC